jgi:hypothetical protein
MDEWIIHSIIAGAAVAALAFTLYSLIRLRKTEQIRLPESILKDIRNSIKDFDVISSEPIIDTKDVKVRAGKIDRYLDNACETLNCYCKLIEIEEINDKRLMDYFRRLVIKWHDNFFVKHIGVEVISSGEYPSLTRVYLRFKREEEESRTGENRNTPKYFPPPKL